MALGVLTDGLEWWFYATVGPNKDEMKQCAKTNIIESDFSEAAETLKLISKGALGERTHEAFQNNWTNDTLNNSWNQLLSGPDENIVKVFRRAVKGPLGKQLPKSEAINFIRSKANPHTGSGENTRRESRLVVRVARNNKQEMHPTRKALLTFLRQEPNATYVRIAEALNMSPGGVSNALRRAIKEKQIRKIKQGRTCTHKVLVDLGGEAKPETGAARSRSRVKKPSAPARGQGVRREITKNMPETMRRLLMLLRRESSATQARVAEVLGMTKSGAYSALKRAEQAGYIRKSKRGRTCTYTVLVSPDAEGTQVRIL